MRHEFIFANEVDKRLQLIFIPEDWLERIILGTHRLTGIPEGSTFERIFYEPAQGALGVVMHNNQFPLVWADCRPMVMEIGIEAV